MGVIGSSKTDMYGKETNTEVRTNKFEDFIIELAECFGRNFGWRVIHRIEKRKLKKQ